MILLRAHIQRLQAPRGGNEGKNPQWRANLQRILRVGGGDVADQRLLQAQVGLSLRVEQHLPRQRRQFRGSQPQHYPQPLTPLLSYPQARPVRAIHRPGEQRLEQLPPHLSHRLLVDRHRAARDCRRQHRRLQHVAPAQQLFHVQLKLAHRLPARRSTYYPHGIVADARSSANL